MKKTTLFLLLIISRSFVYADDGYRLWLKYDKLNDQHILNAYKQSLAGIIIEGKSATLDVSKEELLTGLKGLLNSDVPILKAVQKNSLVIGTPANSPLIASLNLPSLKGLGKEGFLIYSIKIKDQPCIVIAANTDMGLLYGSFHFLQRLQTQKSIANLQIESTPKIQYRLLNHWDNMNRTVERGYAGFSIWKWHLLPGYIDQRYRDYARANASIGINGTVITNVNANAQMMSPNYLIKVAALADIFRPYGIKVYLSAKFSAPIELGRLKTADPFDESVKDWWRKKTDEIYALIPDFGGFIVKANSEGQPGPQNYKRTHADGANMLADALEPHKGIVMWRAFVYSNETPTDRTKQAYDEFKPFDGTFKPNVIVQVKNGPLDFQPREPFHPLFGAMPKTPLLLEFQLTQEYLGQATNLVYEAPLMKEVLDADTYSNGKGSSVAKIIDGSIQTQSITGIAGVSNIGDDRNWCGHPFAQANWYAFGKLAWDHSLTSEKIADDWIKMTLGNNEKIVSASKKMMLGSRESLVNYMTPLGLHHIMGDGHHYGPSPWSDRLGRADWNPVYYHRADSIGIGFDRTIKGSNALEQYQPQVQNLYKDVASCPEEYLLWFHHVSWTYKMKSGKTLWDELAGKYQSGVNDVRSMQQNWFTLKGLIDKEQFEQVNMLLAVQEKEAVWWKNACLLYFQTFSKMPFPTGFELPDRNLEYYKSLRFQFAPGNGGSN